MARTFSPVIRRAVPDDATAIHALVDALADYEHLERPSEAARERLRTDLFGGCPRIECYLAFLDGYPVGYSILCETYSSFLALPTLYLEDLFVLPEFRSRKAGYALFNDALQLAKTRGCGRMEWTVLEWNQLAKDFYERMGAKRLHDWELYRITL